MPTEQRVFYGGNREDPRRVRSAMDDSVARGLRWAQGRSGRDMLCLAGLAMWDHAVFAEVRRRVAPEDRTFVDEAARWAGVRA